MTVSVNFPAINLLSNALEDYLHPKPIKGFDPISNLKITLEALEKSAALGIVPHQALPPQQLRWDLYQALLNGLESAITPKVLHLRSQLQTPCPAKFVPPPLQATPRPLHTTMGGNNTKPCASPTVMAQLKDLYELDLSGQVPLYIAQLTQLANVTLVAMTNAINTGNFFAAVNYYLQLVNWYNTTPTQGPFWIICSTLIHNLTQNQLYDPLPIPAFDRILDLQNLFYTFYKFDDENGTASSIFPPTLIGAAEFSTVLTNLDAVNKQAGQTMSQAVGAIEKICPLPTSTHGSTHLGGNGHSHIIDGSNCGQNQFVQQVKSFLTASGGNPSPLAALLSKYATYISSMQSSLSYYQAGKLSGDEFRKDGAQFNYNAVVVCSQLMQYINFIVELLNSVSTLPVAATDGLMNLSSSLGTLTGAESNPPQCPFIDIRTLDQLSAALAQAAADIPKVNPYIAPALADLNKYCPS